MDLFIKVSSDFGVNQIRRDQLSEPIITGGGREMGGGDVGGGLGAQLGVIALDISAEAWREWRE